MEEEDEDGAEETGEGDLSMNDLSCKGAGRSVPERRRRVERVL
jgi:hypothetical protein